MLGVASDYAIAVADLQIGENLAYNSHRHLPRLFFMSPKSHHQIKRVFARSPAE
jgi:hypothetical protein